MTTLHVREDVLRRAVAGFPSVAGLRVQTDLPHGMTIEVIERHPVAALVAGDQRLAVSADGPLLRDVQDTIGLPSIAQAALPAGLTATGPPHPRRAGGGERRARGADQARPSGIVFRPKGLTVQLARRAAADLRRRLRRRPPSGPARPASWPTRPPQGATYLDLREPGRVSAGGLGPVDGEDPMGDAEQAVPGRPRHRFRRPRRPLRHTLNHRVRMTHSSTSGRDLGVVQRILPRFDDVDIGKEIPVPCSNPRP